MSRDFIELYDDDGYRYIVNMDKISFVNVAGRKVWGGESATLAICDESMERLLSRLRAMLTRDLTPCFVQDFGLGSRTGYEKALLVGLFDRTFTCLDHRISASDEAAGPTRRPVAVVMRRDGRLQEVDPWRVVIDDSEEVFGMYSWMWDEESVVCEQLGLAGVKADRGGDE